MSLLLADLFPIEVTPLVLTLLSGDCPNPSGKVAGNRAQSLGVGASAVDHGTAVKIGKTRIPFAGDIGREVKAPSAAQMGRPW